MVNARGDASPGAAEWGFQKTPRSSPEDVGATPRL